MRSLWRTLALQWLGGDGSQALAGDSTVLQSLLSGEPAQTTPAFDGRREPGVSQRALMSLGAGRRPDAELSLEETLRVGHPSDYLR